jgi:membrane-bound lytic murein transglycosylase D
MTIKRLITVALATVFISALSAEAQDNNVKKNRKSLEQENTELRAKMDSLVAELDRYRAELEVADSIRRELAEQEQMSETDEAQLSPEDYTAEVSDSLLSIWYLQKNTSMEEDIDMDSVKFESSVPDSVYMDSLAKMNSFIRLPYNDIVRNYIILYSEKMGVRIENILGL